jgi:hypothetical protein
MNLTIAPEPGTEVFRGLDGDSSGFDLAFGPVGEQQVLWSLIRVRAGEALERLVFVVPRPSRRALRLWLTEHSDDATASELLGRVGRLQYFYLDYYAARPDLERFGLTAVA